MENHTLSLFLRGVKDLDFDMTVEIQNNKYYNNLIQTVVAIWEKEKGVMKKGSTAIKLGIKRGVFVKRMPDI